MKTIDFSEIIFDCLKAERGSCDSCLLNCSNNGECMHNSNTDEYICECYTEDAGEHCEPEKSVSQLCEDFFCMNNGTCYLNEKSPKCLCNQNFYGKNCENHIDQCKSHECWANSKCYTDQSNNPSCRCIYGYNGTHCQAKRSLILYKIVKYSSVTIAIILIIFFYIFFIVIDILDYLERKQKKENDRKKIKSIKNFFY